MRAGDECPGQRGETCSGHLLPAGPAYLFGHDQDDNEVYMRRWDCQFGHWFTVEVTDDDDYGEVILSG